jgi:hypothetical protein
MALPKYIDGYQPFNQQQKKDFYDLMTPHWSNEMAKQYNQDMEENSTTDAINPSHYKDIVPGYEYFDIMDYMLEGWEGPEAHALGNGLKYLMRLNKKDNNVQELGKAIWYLTRLKSYLEQGGYREYRKTKSKRGINN